STALFAMRAWRDRDEMLRRMLASPLFTSELAGRCEAARRHLRLGEHEPFEWRVVLVNRKAAQVRAELQGAAWLLVVNAPDECVVGGRREDVDALVRRLGAEA